ncbi:transporter EamA [Neoasaia chiangmaiensis NBRC 101099]|uniref:Permease n=1 Tax=Neoasaia chiangmaiensis TaxID=320497 RepID=A0A1U9KLX1_9PROT|nr:DMT family transporter [Neoasaia chiangmaiensis]AQS86775.1 permease [Neoasaia chiangmaiensis]GBR35498.1 transporter EamA [Neoasaia chiangmaiensis NBRC 101099]GEN16369.1 threonine transporter RhtB [Neoasaia chiangmaiensis]
MSAATSQASDVRIQHIGAVAMLVGGISSFQIGAALAKSLFPLFGPTGMVGLRVGFAAVILLIVMRPARTAFRRDVWPLLIPYGASMAVMNFFFYIALTRLPLGLVVALEFMGPLSLALFGSRRALDLLWAVMVAIGVFLLLRPEKAVGHLDPIGVAAALCSGVGWIVYILSGTRIGRTMPAGESTALGMTIGALFLSPWLLPALPLAVTHPNQGMWAVCVAIMSSAVPYILDMMAMRRLKPSELGVLLSMEPMLGALSGLVLLGESLSTARWVGVGCVVAASVGNVLSSRPSVTKPQPPPG